jgi:hypothetical protein
MSIELMKQMVDELEYVLDCINQDKIPFDGDDFHEILRLGRQAIAEAEKQEPVACGYDETTGNCTQNPCCYTHPQPKIKQEPVAEKQEPEKYAMDIECTKCGATQSGILTVTHPQLKREPLTEKQIADFFGVKSVDESFVEFVRAIEAAHGIKGEA